MSPKPGGVILKMTELESLFPNHEPKIVGLALAMPEVNSNQEPKETVNIEIFRCYWGLNDNGKPAIRIAKTPEDSRCVIRAAANMPQRLPGGGDENDNLESYMFEFQDIRQSQKQKFVFAFLSREQFENLKVFQTEEVFVSGAVVDYGTTSLQSIDEPKDLVKHPYFTFKIEPYTIPNNKILEQMPEIAGIPLYQILFSCPTEWANGPNAPTTFWDDILKGIEEARK